MLSQYKSDKKYRQEKYFKNKFFLFFMYDAIVQEERRIVFIEASFNKYFKYFP